MYLCPNCSKATISDSALIKSGLIANVNCSNCGAVVRPKRRLVQLCLLVPFLMYVIVFHFYPDQGLFQELFWLAISAVTTFSLNAWLTQLEVVTPADQFERKI